MEVASQDDGDMSLPSRDDVIAVIRSLKEAFSEREKDALYRLIEEGNVDVVLSVRDVKWSDG
jgi:hypothetical protein